MQGRVYRGHGTRLIPPLITNQWDHTKKPRPLYRINFGIFLDKEHAICVTKFVICK
jgi:hypothetical protein